MYSYCNGKEKCELYIYTDIHIYICVFDWQIGGFNSNCGFVQVEKHVPFQYISMCFFCVSTTNHGAMLPLQATRSNAPGPVASWNAQRDVTTRPAPGWGRQQLTGLDHQTPTFFLTCCSSVSWILRMAYIMSYYVQTAYKFTIDSMRIHSYVHVCVCDSEIPSYSEFSCSVSSMLDV